MKNEATVSFTKREQEVLELMALGLANKEIAQRLSLSRRTVEGHIDHILTKFDAPSRARAVIEAGRAGLLEGTARQSRLGNLPLQTTSFVGRTLELDNIKALVDKSRLVTIAGTGGIGKTRVALQAGVALSGSFGDGVWFIDLAKVSGAHSVIPEVASALGVTSQGSSTLSDRVLAHLRHRKLLLILDNCEHVVAEVARLTGSIITSCPDVMVLATSREKLAVRGEQVYLLPPLDMPSANDAFGAENAKRFGAVALFVERARSANAHFAFTDDVSRVVVEICRQLDGIALAIELAAARSTTLGAYELLKRLREQFRLLSTGDRTLDPRHRTMRAALDWSYEWLSEPERSLFRRVAVFQGGWTLDAIRALSEDEPTDELLLLDKLSSLVDKSLVTVTFTADDQRYRLMEPLRQYGLDLLKEHSELDEVARRHALYFSRFARQAAINWSKVPELAWLASIEAELDNIRAALEWSVVRRNDPVLGAEIASDLGNFWVSRHYHEGLNWLELAQRAVSYEENPDVAVRVAVARMRSIMQMDSKAVVQICNEAQAYARLLKEEVHLRRLLFFKGMGLLLMNRLDEADAVGRELLEKAQRADDQYRLTFALYLLARVNRRRGNNDLARSLSLRMASVYEAMQFPLDLNRWVVLCERARASQLDGDLGSAIEFCRQAQSVTLLTSDPLGRVQTEYFLATLLLLSGAITEARDLGHSILLVTREELLAHGVILASHVLGGVASLQGNHVVAAKLIGWAEARFPTLAGVEVDLEWFRRPLRDHFGEARFAELMADGGAWPEERAVAEAQKL
ncbi:MAG TPA: LuxR C-terminal-related transcriptional regulator [Candidatus Binatus sp.]|nr:LuxR C-terminal-related transcriptional regulator [Candidatus Binatus sp.]